ncbi:MAG: protein translocase subunit SecF [Pseudomonadota bacterium]
MRILSKTPSIEFMGRRKAAVALSVILLIVSVASLAIFRLNFGVDFTGGVLVQVSYPEEVALSDVRGTLSASGYDKATVQYFGSSRDVLVRLPPEASGGNLELDGESDELRKTVGDLVTDALRAQNPQVVQERVEFVGPQVGEELRERGASAMIIALLLILAYIAIRFQWKFAVGAVAALIHDVILVVGFFSLLRLEFDLSVLAAVLAVIGYSLNDTIVVFDRIRENFHDVRKATPAEIMNLSINQMLARTIITGVTTLLVLLALFFVGGESVKPFSIALIVGIIVGTYSSIYVASATALGLNITIDDLLPSEEEVAEIDALP